MVSTNRDSRSATARGRRKGHWRMGPGGGERTGGADMSARTRGKGEAQGWLPNRPARLWAARRLGPRREKRWGGNGLAAGERTRRGAGTGLTEREGKGLAVRGGGGKKGEGELGPERERWPLRPKQRGGGGWRGLTALGWPLG